MTLTHTIVTGSGGLVGGALVDALAGTTLVHRASTSREAPAERIFRWSPAEQTLNLPKVEIDAVVHLAGESIAARRWNEGHKRRVLESRVQGTGLWARTLANLEPRPRVFVCASAVGFYGATGARLVTEEDPRGEGFLADVCEAWESAADPAREAGIRVVHLRFGIILAGEGGALAKMPPRVQAGGGRCRRLRGAGLPVGVSPRRPSSDRVRAQPRLALRAGERRVSWARRQRRVYQSPGARPSPAHGDPPPRLLGPGRSRPRDGERNAANGSASVASRASRRGLRIPGPRVGGRARSDRGLNSAIRRASSEAATGKGPCRVHAQPGRA